MDHIVEALFEFGSPATNSVVGTDGDGVNDSEERNIIGGVTEADDGNVWEIYGSGPQYLKVAGNYWGVGVDGVTRFSNGGPDMQWLDLHKRNGSTMQVGSDFDGVSDALEANLFYCNNPFNALYGTPPVAPSGTDGAWAFFLGPPKNPPTDIFTGWISMRGNQMVNNLIAPFTYADGSGTPTAQGDLWPGFLGYEQPFMNTSAAANYNDLLPTLSASTTAADIIGTYPHPNPTNSFTNIFIDVYVLDPEGWTNGQALALSELTDYSTYTNGFPQGKTYLGTFLDNGPLDRDPAVGSFNFNAAALNLAPGTRITITANYSADHPGTLRGRTQTSNFSNPATLLAPLKLPASRAAAQT